MKHPESVYESASTNYPTRPIGMTLKFPIRNEKILPTEAISISCAPIAIITAALRHWKLLR